MIVPADCLGLVLFAPVLVYSAASDVRSLRIPNWTSLSAIPIFLLSIPWIGWQAAALQLLCAAVVFAIGFGLFAFRILAGGDVKLLSALMLFVPVTTLSQFSLIFSAAMLLGTFLIIGLRQTGMLRATNWKSMTVDRSMPMGLSIAAAGLLHMFMLI